MTTAQLAHEKPGMVSAGPSTPSLMRRGAVAGAITAMGTSSLAASDGARDR